MGTTLRQTQIFLGTESVPSGGTLLLGATAAPIFEAFQSGSGFRLNSGMAFGVYGGRVTFGAAKDMSTRKYIQFTIMSQLYGWPLPLGTFAQGGLRIFFLDGAGNYVGWKILGKDIKNYSPDYGSGFVVHYANPDDAVNGSEWLIERTRAADYSSGTLDWSAVTAVEIQVNHTQAGIFGSTDVSVYLRWLGTYDPHLITGAGNTLASIESTVQTGTGGWDWKRNFQRFNYQFFCLPTVAYASKAEIVIGDGATATELTDSFCALPFWNLFEDDADFQSLGPHMLLAGGDRPVIINQSATCETSLSDMIWSSSSGWSLTIQGSASGVALFTRNQFWRAEYIGVGHGEFVDCVFDGCKTVNLVAASTVTGALVRNANGVGVKVTGAPGDYSDKDLNFDNNTGYDLVVDPAAAGEFDFTGISAAGGYTVKIRNASATHAITVIIPAGITYSTSTAGGTITVENPVVMATASVIGMEPGSRLYVRNVTKATTVVNAVQAGADWELEYEEGTAFSAGDIVTIRITYNNGLVANLEEAYTAIPSSAGFTQLATPTESDVYALYGVDGSTCTEFTWDGSNLQIDVNDVDNTTVIQRIGAWYFYYINTAIGIVELFGGITWDQINVVRVNSDITSLSLDNTKATPLLLRGGRIYRTDGQTVIAATSGSIHLDYDPVYSIDGDVWSQEIEGGLTAAEVMRINLGVLAGEMEIINNGASLTQNFKSQDGLIDRVSATMVGSERTAIVVDGSE